MCVRMRMGARVRMFTSKFDFIQISLDLSHSSVTVLNIQDEGRQLKARK